MTTVSESISTESSKVYLPDMPSVIELKKISEYKSKQYIMSTYTGYTEYRAECIQLMKEAANSGKYFIYYGAFNNAGFNRPIQTRLIEELTKRRYVVEIVNDYTFKISWTV